MSLSKRTARRSVIGIAGAGAAVLLFAGVGSSGADFSASDTGNVQVASGSLQVELSDAQNAGTFQLSYPNLAPGDVKVDKFTVKNTGSIPGTVKIGAPFSNVQASLGNANSNKLTVAVDSYLASTSVTSMPSSVNLGTLNPGQSRTYTVRVGLDQTAGNEWQNRSLSTDVTVTLMQ